MVGIPLAHALLLAAVASEFRAERPYVGAADRSLCFQIPRSRTSCRISGGPAAPSGGTTAAAASAGTAERGGRAAFKLVAQIQRVTFSLPLSASQGPPRRQQNGHPEVRRFGEEQPADVL